MPLLLAARVLRAYAVLFAIVAAALLLASCCSLSSSRSVATVDAPPAPESLAVYAVRLRAQLDKCPRRAVWFVRPAHTFDGVTYPADSTLMRDSVLADVLACTRGGGR